MLDASEEANAWATQALFGVNAHFYIAYPAIVEACHLIDNHPPALAKLRRFTSRMEVITPEPDHVFALMEKWAPRMDFADACAVMLVKRYANAHVLTTDHDDFSAYRVPFASPKGDFY
ncbi:hypothetical protein OpiT1DRAFT_01247 [Opitutaceae bacterium TAV1]|nr:hypothetical protein OpiT1DRAFT_01247 [Opitutaceae bacterium TAV1]